MIYYYTLSYSFRGQSKILSLRLLEILSFTSSLQRYLPYAYAWSSPIHAKVNGKKISEYSGSLKLSKTSPSMQSVPLESFFFLGVFFNWGYSKVQIRNLEGESSGYCNNRLQ